MAKLKKKKGKKKVDRIQKFFDKMIAELEEAKESYEKFKGGTKSRSTAIRKNMQEMKVMAQEVRLKVQDMRKKMD